MMLKSGAHTLKQVHHFCSATAQNLVVIEPTNNKNESYTAIPEKSFQPFAEYIRRSFGVVFLGMTTKSTEHAEMTSQTPNTPFKQT